MGPCQARICHRLIGGLLTERLASEERLTPAPSVQLPLRPVSVRSLTARAEEG